MEHYVEMEELLHKANLVEQQLKRKGVMKHAYGTSSKPSYQKDRKVSFSKPHFEVKPKEEGQPVSIWDELQRLGPRKRSYQPEQRHPWCYKCQGRGHSASECPNKKVIVLKDNEEIETED